MKAVRSTLFSLVDRLSRRQKKSFLATIDIILAPIAFLVAHTILFDRLPNAQFFEQNWVFLLLLAGLGAVFSIGLKMPSIKLNAYESREILRTGAMALFVTVSFSLIVSFSSLYFSRLGIILFGLIFFLFAVAARLAST
jgi:hypothetical protein